MSDEHHSDDKHYVIVINSDQGLTVDGPYESGKTAVCHAVAAVRDLWHEDNPFPDDDKMAHMMMDALGGTGLELEADDNWTSSLWLWIREVDIRQATVNLLSSQVFARSIAVQLDLIDEAKEIGSE